jgi:putative membrane-bound dehydrogenase-like protein
MVMKQYLYLLLGIILFGCSSSKNDQKESGPRRIEILFLGHDRPHHKHNSAEFMPMLAGALSKDGINFTYTDQLSDLNVETLGRYDGLMIYANHDEIDPSQEEALLKFVEEGNGFIPVHCASYCFRNSDAYVNLVGAQFKSHGTDTFTTEIVNSVHPAIQGVKEFSTWDETYVHHLHAEDRTILMERVDGSDREPWTWIKEYGQGRVFYTAYGHDERSWNNPGFHNLMKQGILWAVGDKVKTQWEAFYTKIPALVYQEDVPNIPNYEKRDPVPQYQDPLSPEESKKLIQVPQGFELELFASEPDIVNPISMEWDEKGRLWVLETVDYPNTVREEEGIGDDRLTICEDTNGDGKADKFTVFAENLNIPTSFAFADGGVIISQAPVFLFLKDTDGDDKADVRKVLIDGWGTRDTHAGPSNLTYGFDNQIWGVLGYSGFEGTIAGKTFDFSQGIYRFPPDASDFEYLTPTTNNTWGLGFSEENEVFASTANNTHSVFMPISDKYLKGVRGIRTVGNVKIDGHYAMHPITDKVRQVDVFGGFTAAAGHQFYTARQYPDTYWNQTAFVCEPTGHLVHIAKIEKEGSGYKEKDGWNLFASADEWVAPVAAKVGPDGMVWVLDWYNFIVQHNPTPTKERGGYQAEEGEGNAYVNPLRDRERGRIWRIVYKGGSSPKPLQLSIDNTNDLIDALANDNLFWRMTAQRLLVERGNQDVFPELFEIANSNNQFAAVHALWTIKGLGGFDVISVEKKNVLIDALSSDNPVIRKTAVQILPSSPWAIDAILETKLLQDKDPAVLLKTFLALADANPSEEIGMKLYELSKEEMVSTDAWLARAIHIAAVTHKEGFMSSYLAENEDFENILADMKKASDEMAQVSYDDSDWDEMDLPGLLPEDVDGVVWFRKEIDFPAEYMSDRGRLFLNTIDDSDETWLNGVKVGEMLDSKDIRRAYRISDAVLQPGKNVITVKLTDLGGPGGFTSNRMFIDTSEGRISLQGSWKYNITRKFKRGEENVGSLIADNFMLNYWNAETEISDNDSKEIDGRKINVSSVRNQMKFDKEQFEVKAGETITIIFANTDFMQHNLLILKQGTLEKVGQAADELATSSNGVDRGYVPNVPEVLFSTRLIDPNETVKLTFTVPDEPGSYPFVCTFPGHWRTMNGVMIVKPANDPS